MADYQIRALGESQISISGNGQLDGVTQGDGSHLVNLTITINSTNFEDIFIRDNGSDTFFDDNDGNQRATVAPGDDPADGIEFDGVIFSNNTRIEAEYSITLRDPISGDEYQAVAVNFNNSNTSVGSVEGLAFVDDVPPVGVPLEVIAASEGPGDFGIPEIEFQEIVPPPCFTPGTRILTSNGERAVEDLVPGDLIMTLDHGLQVLRWIGQATVDAFAMAMSETVRPVRIRKNAFGPARPARDMLVSPQHRVLLEGWQAELLYGEPQVLVAATHLIDDVKVTRAWDTTETTYFHLQFDRHELLYSDGLLTESFNPGPNCLAAIPKTARKELKALFPHHDFQKMSLNPSVRRMITGREARALKYAV